MAPPSPPRRKRDTVQRENFADLVDEKRRHLVKSKEFSLDDGSFTPGEVEVVLFDVYSLDSFVACCAARAALTQHAQFEGVTRNGSVEQLEIDVTDKVVAMVGVCWDYETMRDLCCDRAKSILVLESEDSLPEVEKSELINLGVWIETDSRFGAGVLAWEFFNKGEPVPLLLRAVEDIHLGRGVFLDGKAMEDGIDALLEDDDIENVTLAIQGLLCPLGYREKIFQKFHSLLTDSKETKRRLQTIADRGRAREPEIRKDQLEAVSKSVVRVFRHFPAWKCNMVMMTSKFEGRVAEFLAESLAQRCQGQENRCMGAVLEMKEGSTVRVTLRSLDGGPDVSEVAHRFEGCGTGTRAFFKVRSDLLESSLEQPEIVLPLICRRVMLVLMFSFSWSECSEWFLCCVIDLPPTQRQCFHCAFGFNYSKARSH
ncbi:unnamed protein product [Durusdinium trenchii]|uniref:Uncharacterized protein n=1 Tax=Durusdinium trenchii TaxID=1381693 RepID=A0ABP0KQ93_9DINO